MGAEKEQVLAPYGKQLIKTERKTVSGFCTKINDLRNN